MSSVGQLASRPPAAARSILHLAAPLLLLLAACGIVLLCWAGIEAFLYTWERPEYSHGYLIPPIAVFLFLNQMGSEHGKNAHHVHRGFGLLVLVTGILVSVLGDIAHMPDVTAYGLIILVASLVLIVMGTSRGLRFWPAIVYLLFMLPLPAVVYWRFSLELQYLSSEIGVGLIRLFGVPVFLSGNIIDLGNYQLQVAEACSGLRYLFPLMSFGYLFAALYKGPAWHRLVLFASTVPITILMNSFRIGAIGVLVDRFGIAQAEGFLHVFEGWIIFIVCVVVLYGEAALLRLTLRDGIPVHRMLEINFSVLAAQLRRIVNIPASRALTFAAIVLPLIGGALHLLPAPTSIVPPREPLVLFPAQVGSWHGGGPQLLDRDTEQVLDADDYLVTDFGNGAGGPPVNFFVAYYEALSQGGFGIHSPEQCLPAGGWEVSGWSTINTGLATSSGQALEVNRAEMRKGSDRELVYFWLVQRGKPMTSFYRAKISTFVDALTRGRSDGALVRVVTPILPDESPDSADRRLRAFLGETLPDLPRFLPL